MNWVVDEAMTHRLIGASVILVLAAILMPALMQRAHHVYTHNELELSGPTLKKAPASHQNFAGPTKFKSQPLAHVDLQKVELVHKRADDLQALAIVAQSSSKAALHQAQRRPSIIKKVKVKPLIIAPVSVIKSATPVLATKSNTIVSLVQKRPGFAVQLGSFANIENAASLVTQLKRQGYAAAYQKIAINNKTMFKVTVGPVADRVQAQQLQTRLAQTSKLTGMIVKTGVS